MKHWANYLPDGIEGKLLKLVQEVEEKTEKLECLEQKKEKLNAQLLALEMVIMDEAEKVWNWEEILETQNNNK